MQRKEGEKRIGKQGAERNKDRAKDMMRRRIKEKRGTRRWRK